MDRTDLAELQGAGLLVLQEALQLLRLGAQSSRLGRPDLLLRRSGRLPLLQRRNRLG